MMDTTSGWNMVVDISGNITKISPGIAEGDAIPVPPDMLMTILANPSAFIWTGTEIVRKPPTLQQAKSEQIAAIRQSYQQAIQKPVSYTSNDGSTNTYQSDPGSVANLQSMLLAFAETQVVPSGFYWVAADNSRVPFTYADMQGLAQAIGTQAAEAFRRFQTQKSAVRSATTVSDVQAVTW
jgi:hypothetical protein